AASGQTRVPSRGGRLPCPPDPTRAPTTHSPERRFVVMGCRIPTVVVVALLILATRTYAAGESCGDTDASGAVTVTDGVNVLRAAADLSSPCTLERCDINADGSITVSDGVNVLRAAADLPATLACGVIDPAVAALVSDVFPFVGDSQLLIGTPGVNPCTDG